MIFFSGGNISSNPDPGLAKIIDNLLEQERKEKELCPKCEHDTGGYNITCARCDDFCNFKEKRNG